MHSRVFITWKGTVEQSIEGWVKVLQVRSAYRRRGWGFTDPQQISQCAKEGFVEKLKAQEGEGCHMWGTLAVNKVSTFAREGIHVNAHEHLCKGTHTCECA